jgi:hypothetical protein
MAAQPVKINKTNATNLRTDMPVMNKFARLLFALIFCTVTFSAHAEVLALRDGHPDRYVVKEGDTLWHISSQFLEDPWRWPEIWQANTFIDDPHLIYPGDVLIFTNIDGVPGLRLLRRQNLATVKSSPTIRRSDVSDAITTIPPGIIRAFLTQPLIVGKKELEESGYVVIGVDDNFLLGEGLEFYARDLPKPVGKLYQVFRSGEHLMHPVTEEYLGTEAVYLGDARMLREGEISKLVVTKGVEEIGPTDRLVEIEEDIAEPYYHPHAPEDDVLGHIIKAPGSVSEVGVLQVVVLSLGEVNGMEEGHVLRVRHKKPQHRDPITRKMIDLPEEDSGLLMVFRVFDRVSYALIMKATRAIHINDTVVSPLK